MVSFQSLTTGIRFKKSAEKPEECSVKLKVEDKASEFAAEMLDSEEARKKFRKFHGIRVDGTDLPIPLVSWADLAGKIPDKLLDSLISVYPNPTPIQMQSIPAMFRSRDLLASSPTGSGKTAAYLVPILGRQRTRAVILCPTRELSLQIREEAIKLEGGTSKIVIASSKKPGSLKGARIIISTPNTLVYLINEGKCDLSPYEWLIVDESDKLFEDKGALSFREQLAVVYKACLKSRKAFFSATLAADVENWCKLNLDNAVSVTIGIRNVACKDVKQKLVYSGNEKGKLFALKNLIQEGIKPPVLIFVQEMQRADELKEILLKQYKLKAEVIHSHRSQLQREDALKSFRAGRTWILICTELLSRGIDVKGVNLVINYDFPPSTFSYIHRVGRTGRAGRPGNAITFFTDQDKVLLRSVAQIVSSSGNPVPGYMLKLKKASRQEKRRLASSSVKRDSIKGESKYDKKKRLKKESMIEASKRRKLKETSQADKDTVSSNSTEDSSDKKTKKRKRDNEEPIESRQSPNVKIKKKEKH